MRIHNEDLELQIRLAELQADVQINLTVCFGMLAVLFAVMVGIEQIYFTLPQESSFIRYSLVAAIAIAGFSCMYVVRVFGGRVDRARKNMQELKKEYVW